MKHVLILSTAASRGSRLSRRQTVVPTMAVCAQPAMLICSRFSRHWSASMDPAASRRIWMCPLATSWSMVSRMYSGFPRETFDTKLCTGEGTISFCTPMYKAAYSWQRVSLNSVSDTNQPFWTAFFTVACDLSASLTSMVKTTGLSPPSLQSCMATFVRAATTPQKGLNLSSVLENRLVPYSNCKTIMMGVSLRRVSRSETTISTIVYRTVCRCSSSVDPPKAAPTSGRAWAKCGGASCCRAFRSSAGTDGSRCRKMLMVLRSSSTPSRSKSEVRGPTVPKTGSMPK
mmetsp:Transcript_56332/g.171538  ORF Transcript_56332/g.171538 Transcript_56332/m.171538 type:complete len:287 (-) Transcript_56332:2025-2885(-)